MLTKSIIKDLNFIFNYLNSETSESVLILGQVSYKNMIDADLCNIPIEIKHRIHRLIIIAKYIEFYKNKIITKELSERTDNVNKLLSMYCTSTKENKLGKSNHKYKKNIRKLELKILRASNLRSTSTD